MACDLAAVALRQFSRQAQNFASCVEGGPGVLTGRVPIKPIGLYRIADIPMNRSGVPLDSRSHPVGIASTQRDQIAWSDLVVSPQAPGDFTREDRAGAVERCWLPAGFHMRLDPLWIR